MNSRGNLGFRPRGTYQKNHDISSKVDEREDLLKNLYLQYEVHRPTLFLNVFSFRLAMPFKAIITGQDIAGFYVRTGRVFELAHTSSAKDNDILTLILTNFSLANNEKNRKKVSKLIHRYERNIIDAVQRSVGDVQPLSKDISANTTSDNFHEEMVHEKIAANTQLDKSNDMMQLSRHESSIDIALLIEPSTRMNSGSKQSFESLALPLFPSTNTDEQPIQALEVIDVDETLLRGPNIAELPATDEGTAIEGKMSVNTPPFSAVTEEWKSHYLKTVSINETPVTSLKENFWLSRNASKNVPTESIVLEKENSQSVISEESKFASNDPAVHSVMQRFDDVEKHIKTQKLAYSEKHGYVIVPKNVIIDENDYTKNRSSIYSFLRENIKKLNLSCILAFKSTNFRQGTERFVLYAHCAHKYDKSGCMKRFRFDFSYDSDVGIAMVHSNGEPECHDDKRVAQCRGWDRDKVKRQLHFESPYRYRMNKVKEADNLQLDLGNLQEIRPLKTIQKINQEMAHENLRSQHDIHDVIMRYEEEKYNNVDAQYIQRVQQPLSVQCFSSHTIIELKKILKEADMQRKFILYLDATGSLVRKQRSIDGAAYYYAGVVAVNGITIPLLENISNQHTMEAICSFLFHFKTFCKKLKKWPLFSVVVVDFSYAFIHAVMLAWNEMSLDNYLALCFAFYQNEISPSNMRQMVHVQICCAHIIGIVKRFCGQSKLSGPRKWFIMEVTALLIQCQTVSKAMLVISQSLYILQSKCYDENARARLQGLKEMFSDIDVELRAEVEKPEIEAEDAIRVTEKLQKGLKKNSPFGKMGLKVNKVVKWEIRMKKKEAAGSKQNENPYYCPRFAQRLLTLYIPLLPLWTGVMLSVSLPKHVTRLSNANVESWFNKVKTHIFEGKRNMRPGIFVQRMKEEILVMMKDLTYVPRPKTKMKNEATKRTRDWDKSEECDDELECLSTPTKKSKVNTLITERWGKRRKNRYTLFQGKNISKYSSKPVILSRSESTNTMQKSITCIASLQLKDEELYATWAMTEKRLRADPDRQYKISDWFGAYALYSDILRLYFTDEPGYIDQCVIDECATQFIRRYALDSVKIMYVPLIYSNVMLGYLAKQLTDWHDGEDVNDINLMEWSNAEQLIIPFLPSPRHFALAVVHMERKRLIVFDSLVRTKEQAVLQSENILHQFKKFLTIKMQYSANQLSVTGWDVELVNEYQRQSDIYNCGVYVLWYIHQILRAADLNEAMDPNHFRKVICWHLFPTEEIVNRQLQEKGIYPHHRAMFMPNLFDDVKYYCGTPEIAEGYVVAKYHGLFKEPILVSGSDMESLNPDKWLTGNAINACVSALLQDYPHIMNTKLEKNAVILCLEERKRLTELSQVRVFQTAHSLLLTNENTNIDYDVAYRTGLLPFHNETMHFVLPLNLSGNHWTVLFIDISTGSYQYYDSVERCHKDDQIAQLVINFIQNFNTVLSKKDQIKHENWSDVTPEYPKQTDDHSCGLFVLIYIYKFVFDEYISLHGLRERLQIKLLYNSRGMMDLCLYCGLHVTPLMFRRGNAVKWVLCANCRRWVHYKCIKPPNKPDFDDLNNGNFKCILCQNVEFNPPPPPENWCTLEKPVGDPYHFCGTEDDEDTPVSEISYDLSF